MDERESRVAHGKSLERKSQRASRASHGQDQKSRDASSCCGLSCSPVRGCGAVKAQTFLTEWYSVITVTSRPVVLAETALRLGQATDLLNKQKDRKSVASIRGHQPQP